jgi:serine/threonine protein phosphatase PrpC
VPDAVQPVGGQDAHVCEPVFNGNRNWGFFAVLDGHGGKQAADYSEAHLAKVRGCARQRRAKRPPHAERRGGHGRLLRTRGAMAP